MRTAFEKLIALRAAQRKEVMVHLEDELATHQTLPRRQFIQRTGGGILALALPIQLGNEGCDPETVETVATIIFLLAKTTLLVAELIEGDVKITSPNAQCRVYDITMDLVSALGGGMDSSSSRMVELCQGQSLEALGQWGLSPSQTGGYQINTMFDGKSFSSPSFDVRAS
jgi:hypothetical protein